MHPQKAKSPNKRKQTSIDKLIEEVVPNADIWRKTPNDRLGGMTPEELIGTPSEDFLRNMLEMIKYGMFT